VVSFPGKESFLCFLCHTKISQLPFAWKYYPLDCDCARLLQWQRNNARDTEPPQTVRCNAGTQPPPSASLLPRHTSDNANAGKQLNIPVYEVLKLVVDDPVQL